MWLEIVSRHHDVIARHRCAGDEIRVGRGYDNDIILDDPCVAPHHLRLYRGPEGGWVAEDLGTANGLQTERGKVRLERIGLDGDQIIQIGRTLLRIREPAYAVAAERVAVRQRPLWPLAVILAIGIIGIEILSAWLAETAEPRPLAYLDALRNVGLMTLGWVGVWTILCRVFAGQARFERHLLIALAGVFSYSLFDEILKLAGFALSWQPILGYEYVAMWAVVGIVCCGHMFLIAPRRHRLTGGIVAALALLAVTTETLTQNEIHRNADPPPVQGRLYPPALRLATAQPEDQFFADVAKLKAKLDADRKDDDP